MSTAPAAAFVEQVEIHGHIIDSLILPKVLDEILTHGCSYVLNDIRIGQRQNDPSYARIEVRAPSAAVLQEVLAAIHDHGAAPVSSQDCTAVPADM
ncbi:MAG TPA: TIGR00300 family protein, partial [Gemmataceae bacterium]|nr:TIGR00300 family protein [Gemmataceae bacterium]